MEMATNHKPLNAASRIHKLLDGIAKGSVSTDKAFTALKDLPYEDIGFARIDHHRALRKGNPEVIFAPGKTVHQVIEIARRIQKKGDSVLVTRVDKSLWMRFRKKRVWRTKYQHCNRIPQTLTT